MAAHPLTRNTVARLGLPIVAGACVAGISAVLLSGLPPVWIALLFGAGLTVIPSLVVDDPMAYWLYVLLLTLPFDISKMFGGAERAIGLMERFGDPWSGPPAFNLHLTELPLVPLLGLWLVGKIRKRERIAFPHISYVPLAFLCFITLTTLVAPFPYFAFLGLIKQWKYFVIYLFAVDTLDVRKYGKAILTILLLTLLMQGTLTVVRYRLQVLKPVFGDALGRMSAIYLREAEGTRNVADAPDSIERGFGTFYNANPTAMHLELLLPFALALALSTRSWRWKSVYASLFVVGTAGLCVTFSRAGMVAFLASTLACLFVASLRGLIPRKIAIRLLGVGLFAGLCLVPLLVAYMQTRPKYSEYHAEHLRQGIAIALSHPIFGVGLNNSSVVRPYLAPGGLMYGENNVPIHSAHLLGLSETGVIGFGLYIGFFILVGIEAFRRSKSENFYARVFSIGIFGGYTAMCLHMITDYMGVEAFHEMLWLHAGIIVAQRRWDAVAATAGRTSERPLLTGPIL